MLSNLGIKFLIRPILVDILAPPTIQVTGFFISDVTFPLTTFLFMFRGDENQKGFKNAIKFFYNNRKQSLRIIEQVGNYGESYKKHLGDTGIMPNRGPNQLWTKGGILYVPPAR